MLTRFWLMHLPGILGPFAVWAYLYFTRISGKISLWQPPYWEVCMIGAIGGMSFGYLIALVKWARFLRKLHAEAPPGGKASK